MKRIVSAEALPGYRVKIRFDDGVEGIVDLSDELGKEAFAAWNDPENFKRVRIGDFGELVWDENIDLCPDALYLEITGMTVGELFPNWKQEDVNRPVFQ